MVWQVHTKTTRWHPTVQYALLTQFRRRNIRECLLSRQVVLGSCASRRFWVSGLYVAQRLCRHGVVRPPDNDDVTTSLLRKQMCRRRDIRCARTCENLHKAVPLASLRQNPLAIGPGGPERHQSASHDTRRNKCRRIRCWMGLLCARRRAEAQCVR